MYSLDQAMVRVFVFVVQPVGNVSATEEENI